MTSLPAGWDLRRLGDVATIVAGKTPKALDQWLADRPRTDRTVPFYKVGDMNTDASYMRDARVKIAPDEVSALGLRLIAAGSSVFPKVGGAVLTNKKRLVSVPGAIDLNTMAATPNPGLHSAFLRHWLEALDLRRLVDGSVLPQLSSSRISALKIPLPTPGEQRRIVELLDDHFSRLDAADALLAASSTRLLALDRALVHRLMQDAGGHLRPLKDVADIQGGLQKQPNRAPRSNRHAFLRVANVSRNGLALDEVHEIELFPGEIDRYRLDRGDLLVVEGNGSASQIGRAALWDGSIANCVHQNHLIRVRPHADVIAPEYLDIWWNSAPNRASLTALASSSSGLHTLSVGKLRRLEVQTPRLDTQRALASVVRQKRVDMTRVEASLGASQRRSMSLRRALLDAAFTGRLTGGPTDIEKAEELAEVSG